MTLSRRVFYIFRQCFLQKFFIDTSFLIAIFIFWVPPSWSYTLKLDTILSKTTQNHGRGFYRVEQDVFFSHGEEPLVVREIWTVRDGERMHLEIVGQGNLKDKIHMFSVYQENKKYKWNTSGNVTSTPLSPNWLEPYFHFRKAKRMKMSLLRQKMIPLKAFQKNTPPLADDDEKMPYTPESFVHLSRVGGMVSYGISYLGSPSAPSTWIQQDQFHLQRLRLLSQAQVTAKKYKRFARGLWLPSHRQVTWGQHRVEIKLIHVIPLSKSQKVLHQLNPKNLNKNPYVSIEDKIIKDFYHRFR